MTGIQYIKKWWKHMFPDLNYDPSTITFTHDDVVKLLQDHKDFLCTAPPPPGDKTDGLSPDLEIATLKSAIRALPWITTQVERAKEQMANARFYSFYFFTGDITDMLIYDCWEQRFIAIKTNVCRTPKSDPESFQINL